jgi:serine/threonine protein phosphatase 1
MEDKRRIIIVSDVHGCIEEFKELLDLINYKSPNVRAILLGDLIDRGPEKRPMRKN